PTLSADSGIDMASDCVQDASQCTGDDFWLNIWPNGTIEDVSVRPSGEFAIAGASSNGVDFGLPSGRVGASPNGAYVAELDADGHVSWARAINGGYVRATGVSR